MLRLSHRFIPIRCQGCNDPFFYSYRSIFQPILYPPELCCSSSFSNLIVSSLEFVFTQFPVIVQRLYRYIDYLSLFISICRKAPPFSGQNICLLLYYSSSSIADSSHQRLLFPYDQFERLLSQPGRGSISYFSALCRHALSDIPLSTQSVPGLDSGSDRKIIMGFLHIFAPYSFNLHHLYPSVPTVLLSYISLIFYISILPNPGKMEKIFHVHSLYSLMLEYILPFLSCQSPGNHRISTSSKSAIILNYKGYYTYLLRSSDSLPQTQPYIAQNNLRSLPDHQGFLGNGLSYHSGQLCSLKTL